MLGQLSQFNCTWARSQRYVLFVFLRSTRTFHLTQFICMEYLIFSFSIFMSSITGRRSNLSTQNKITPYKTIIKPVWTYGIQLWGTASNSNIEILQRFHSKTLRSLINAPWYVTNEAIHRDLKIPTVKEEITKCSNRIIKRVNKHQNPLITKLLNTSADPQAIKTLSVRPKH